MSSGIKIQGYEEAVKMLEHLPDKLQRRVLIRIMKQAAKPVVLTARSLVSGKSKRVARSVTAWEPRGKTDPVVFVGPKKTSNPDRDPWFAHIIEGGSKGVKKSAGGKYFRFKGTANLTGVEIYTRKKLRRGGVGTRYRKDAIASPFMQPAVDQNREAVKSYFIDDIDNIIQTEVNKLK